MYVYEGLDGVWNSLICKNLASYSFFKILAYSFKKSIIL